MNDATRKRLAVPPRAILFDLDGTLDDRPRSVARYAEHFHAAFADRLVDIAISSLGTLLQAADGDGYRHRDAVCNDLQRLLPWQATPDVQQIIDHWFTWLPVSAAPREGLDNCSRRYGCTGLCSGS